MEELYNKMLDSDNFLNRQKTLADHQKNVEKLYLKFPDLKKLDTEIANLQKEYAIELAKKIKGEKSKDIKALQDRLDILIQQKNQFLNNNNIPVDYKEPQWNCEKCQDRGKIYTPLGVKGCDCQIDDSLIFKKRRAGLTPKIQNATFENTNFLKYLPNDRKNAETVYKVIQNYLNKLVTCIKKGQAFQEGIFIHGQTGSGKTHLLGCIANFLIQQQIDVLYVVYADLLDKIRETYNEEATETESAILRRVTSVSVLLIDDLGMEKNSEFAQKYLAQIIDHRYRNMLPTIITSNFTLSELKERSKNDMYGERVIWRLVEISHLFQLTGNLRNTL
ncbi:replicative DNA helicase loader DnaI [Anaerobranca californiensis DSM 14826]|jgi:DNA replication protein DnaC|uniref:Replicative DNA helicase loader DnaI n=1 Tax=Anaerobranca californiensis DSM 14826 TaxID=1120989 RepID=A0A1M6N9K8_9FIRM|nr:ATP-binding protein [Anaerobranca californiensis]SHJ92246.1 replicative DNA helicase loader DnaI [Anaerobranca californiensis DSM 14826]